MNIKKLKLNLTKKNIFIFVFVFAILGGSALLYQIFTTRGANYSWVQTSWSGGASTTAKARHTNNQTGWTNFYSKDTLLSTSTAGELTLTASTSSNIDTTFSVSSSTSNTYVSGGTVFLKKPNGVSCSSSNQCVSGICGNGYCRNCEGYLYDSKCWHMSAVNQSCVGICTSYGGSAGAANDTASCDVQKHFYPSCICQGGDSNLYPGSLIGMGGTDYCSYSTAIGGWSSSASNIIVNRLCACLY